MIETYAFLAMFTVQILAGSGLCPALFIRRIRADSASFPDERFAELFPGVNKDASTRRFVTRYRNQNAGITALGLLLLGWLYIYTRRPDWHEGPVLLLICVYLFVQMAPQMLIARNAENYNKRLRASVKERKRRAVLERRGLFDFTGVVATATPLTALGRMTAVAWPLRERTWLVGLVGNQYFRTKRA